MWSIVKFVLFGWKRCVLFKYQLITNQLQIKQIKKVKDLLENKTTRKKKNHVCDLLFLAKRHECLH